MNRLDLWQSFLAEIDAKRVLEIGVWKGEFAAHMLHGCPGIERYYMLDAWRALPEWNKPLNTAAGLDAAYKEAMAATAFAGNRVTVLRGTTAEVIDGIPDGSLDFIYVDGDHTLRGIAIDLIRSYPKLKPGGHLGGDDFDTSAWRHGFDYEPTLVFPFAVYFAEAVGAPIEALPCGQFRITKPQAGGAFSFTDRTGAYGDRSVLAALRSERKGPLRRAAARLRRLLRR